MKTALYARLASRPIPRVTRMMGVARDLGFECTYIGAQRDNEADTTGEWDGFPVVRVGTHFPLVNGKRPWTYLTGVARYNRALFRELRARRPAFVHASDFEVTPSCCLYKLMYRKPLIYNIHDNLADRYPIPRVLRSVLNALEGAVVLLSSRSVVPEEFRRTSLPSWCRARVSVIRNSPQDMGWVEPKMGERRIRILYAGWLDTGRGLSGLLQLAREHDWLEVRIAGEGDQEIIDEITSAGATYLGFLGHREVMTETGNCDLVAAFYDPVRRINRAAAPNKLAEALSVGRPVLINEEVLVGQSESLQDCLVRVPYGDLALISGKIWKIFNENAGSRFLEMCQAARKAYLLEYDWLMVREQMATLHVQLNLSGVERG